MVNAFSQTETFVSPNVSTHSYDVKECVVSPALTSGTLTPGWYTITFDTLGYGLVDSVTYTSSGNQYVILYSYTYINNNVATTILAPQGTVFNSVLIKNIKSITFLCGGTYGKVAGVLITGKKSLNSALSQSYYDNNISVYPNPTTGIVNVKNDGTTPAELTVYDINGKMIQKEYNTNTTDISNQLPGLYFLNITTPEGIITKKIVIE